MACDVNRLRAAWCRFFPTRGAVAADEKRLICVKAARHRRTKMRIIVI
jgi:hypothetical protein